MLLLVLAACAASGEESTGGAGARRARIERDVVVFCDVTKSLTTGEFEEVKRIVGDVIKSYQPPARIEVFPIYLETERANALKVFRIASAQRPSHRRKLLSQRDRRIEELQRELQALYEDVNSVGADPNRSCILNGLAGASQLFESTAGEGRATKELVIISDMVEECDATVLGLVRLNRRDIEREIALAEGCSGMLSLEGVGVTVVTPFEARPVRRPDRPDQRSLERFWKAVFRCGGLTERDLRNAERFSFGRVPARFQPTEE